MRGRPWLNAACDRGRLAAQPQLCRGRNPGAGGRTGPRPAGAGQGRRRGVAWWSGAAGDAGPGQRGEVGGFAAVPGRRCRERQQQGVEVVPGWVMVDVVMRTVTARGRTRQLSQSNSQQKGWRLTGRTLRSPTASQARHGPSDGGGAGRRSDVGPRGGGTGGSGWRAAPERTARATVTGQPRGQGAAREDEPIATLSPLRPVPLPVLSPPAPSCELLQPLRTARPPSPSPPTTLALACRVTGLTISALPGCLRCRCRWCGTPPVREDPRP